VLVAEGFLKNLVEKYRKVRENRDKMVIVSVFNVEYFSK
jgi:hypothetical protein